MRRFRELTTPIQKGLGAIDAIEWEFPRAIPKDETENSAWFRWGSDVVFWYVWDGELPKVLRLHVAVRPESRSRWLSRRWLLGIQLIGELLGAASLEATDCTGAITEASYWPRVGWTTVEAGLWRLELTDGGGARHGNPNRSLGGAY